MALTRRMLREMGLEQEQIDRIMDAHGGSMAEMITRAEAEDQTRQSVEKAKAEWQKSLPKEKKAEDYEEYKALKTELDGIRQAEALREAKVKDKYLDIVRSKVDFGHFDESIRNIKRDFAEFFEADNPQPETPDTGTAQAGFPAFSAPGKSQPAPTETETAQAQIRKAFGLEQ